MFRKRVWLPILSILVIAMGCGLFYSHKVANQEPTKVYKPVEIEKPVAPKPPPPGETAESGHWHGDEWHADPHEPLPTAQSTPTTAPPGVTTGGYWSNASSTTVLVGYMPAYPRGSLSNPYLPTAFPTPSYARRSGSVTWGFCGGRWDDGGDDRARGRRKPRGARAKVREVGREVMAQYNPNRPIHEVWPRFIEAELFYQANADVPPLDPERHPPGSFAEFAAAPERMEAVDRIDWLFQHVLDYPEVMEIMRDDKISTYNNAWRMELGFDKPDWNVVELFDGRKLRERSGYYYEVTYREGNETLTYKGGHSGKDAPLVKINLNEISDEELEALGIDYSIIPYRQGGK